MLFGLAGISEPFSVVAQNIMSATYKEMGGVDKVGGRLRLPFRHNGTSCCAK